MNDYAFREGMNRLRQIYGEQAYPAERTVVIAEKVQILTDEDWNQVLKQIIGSCRYAPMADQIRDIAMPFLKVRWAEEAQRKRNILEQRRKTGESCQYCDDSGGITAFKRETKYSFYFRCPDKACIAAEIQSNPKDVTWDDSYLQDYLPWFHSDNHCNHFELANPNLNVSLDDQKDLQEETRGLAQKVLEMIATDPAKVSATLDQVRKPHARELERQKSDPSELPEGYF